MVRPTRKKAGAALMETGEIPLFVPFRGWPVNLRTDEFLRGGSGAQ